jgi:hypothetical protein
MIRPSDRSVRKERKNYDIIKYQSEMINKSMGIQKMLWSHAYKIKKTQNNKVLTEKKRLTPEQLLNVNVEFEEDRGVIYNINGLLPKAEKVIDLVTTKFSHKLTPYLLFKHVYPKIMRKKGQLVI